MPSALLLWLFVLVIFADFWWWLAKELFQLFLARPLSVCGRLFVWLDFHLNVKRLFAWQVCRRCSHPMRRLRGYNYLCDHYYDCRCMHHADSDIAVRPWVN